MSSSQHKTKIRRRSFFAVTAGAASALWGLLRGRKRKRAGSNDDEPKPPIWIGHM